MPRFLLSSILLVLLVMVSTTLTACALDPQNFNQTDANHDGKLTLDEVRKTYWDADREFGYMDANGDGIVTRAEYNRYMPGEPAKESSRSW